MAIAVGLLATLLVAAPASAHTISGPRPTNFRTRITSVTPDVPGVTRAGRRPRQPPRAHERHRRRRDRPRARRRAVPPHRSRRRVRESALARDLFESHAIRRHCGSARSRERATRRPAEVAQGLVGPHVSLARSPRALDGRPTAAGRARARPTSSSASASGTCRSITARRGSPSPARSIGCRDRAGSCGFRSSSRSSRSACSRDCGSAGCERWPRWSGCSSSSTSRMP